MKDEDFISLDFNRRETIQPRFSTSKVKHQFKNHDVASWASKIKAPSSGLYAYPAILDKAIIHQQSCYLSPDEKFLDDNQGIHECDCCGQKIKRRREKYMTLDLYDSLVPEFGITIPLYFTLLKLHILLLFIIGIIFGGFFCYYSYVMCNEYPLEQKDNKDVSCLTTNNYFFLPQDEFIHGIQKHHPHILTLYYTLSFVVFSIIMITPIIHEILLRAIQIKYWQYDPYNHIKFKKLSVYAKHLPRKMTETEIQQSIYEALQRSKKNKQNPSQLFDPETQAIEELLYIYDTHPISVLNKKRQDQFLQLLKISYQIQESQKTQQLLNIDQQASIVPNTNDIDIELKKQKFIAVATELMIQTKEIKLYMNEGLPYTNKIIIKFKTEEQANAVYQHFNKGFFGQLQSQIKVLRQSRQLQKELDATTINKVDIRSSMLSDFSQSSTDSARAHKKSSDLMQNLKLDEVIDQQSLNNKTQLKANNNNSDLDVKDYIQIDDLIETTAKARLEVERRNEIEEGNKNIHISRGFREDDIFWENIGTFIYLIQGMSTLKRFNLRMVTFATSIIASVLCMGVFDYLFNYQNNPQMKANISDGKLDLLDNIFINLMTILIVFLAVLSSLIIISTTLKSRRSTYTLQEMNIINFMSFSQLVLVLSFPYFMVLTVWGGLHELLPIYNLFLLSRVRVIFKGISHIFHLRSCSFWCRRRKITKRFDGSLYFQKQLNILMTPGMFPMRARLLFALFVFSTGYLMIFIAPFMIIICLIFQIFFYFFDRYTLYKVFIIDKQFTFRLMNYLISSQNFRVFLSYQIIMTPIYTYIYVTIYMKREYEDSIGIGTDKQDFHMQIKSRYMGIAGLSLGISSWILFIFFKRVIADFFVFRILKLSKPIRDTDRIFEEKTYFESYQKYFESLGIEEMNTALTNIFKSLELKKK